MNINPNGSWRDAIPELIEERQRFRDELESESCDDRRAAILRGRINQLTDLIEIKSKE